MQLRTTVLLFFLLLSCLGVHSQRLDFFREDLTFQLDSTHFTVSGQYFFRNNTSSQKRSLISYPFPRLTDGPLFDTILVFSEENLAIPFQFHDTLISFEIRMQPGSEQAITIIYSQRHNGNYAKYILTTTKYWGKPLQLAEFKMVVPDYINILNYFEPPDKTSEFEGTSIYHWTRQNFLPANDFEIWFEIIPKP